MALDPLFLNYCFDKNRLKNLITWSLLATGEMQTIRIVENLKALGFQFATKAGISLSLDDLKIPPEKMPLVSQATQQVEDTQQDYQRGHLTAIERSQHLIDTWHRTSETLKQTVVNNFQLTDKLSPVYMMAFSGARGNISQVRQLAGMRGLMADPQGQIIGFPIRSNFREGLTLTEYMISCYGARKGLVDTALRTADAGYLTRRLVDVSQHMIVKTATCATSKGILLQDLQASGKVILPLRDRLIGRVLAQDVCAPSLAGGDHRTPDLAINTARRGTSSPMSNPRSRILEAGSRQTDLKKPVETAVEAGKDANDSVRVSPDRGSLPSLGGVVVSRKGQGTHLVASRNQEISIELASSIASSNSRVYVRSPLTCSVRYGVCQLCYGWSLSEGRLVTLGEAVGIIAAQSIGEPGTQLTMRTFHTGGVFSGDVMAEIRAPFDGIASFPLPLQGLLIRTSHGKVAFLTRTDGVVALNKPSLHSLLKKGAALRKLPGVHEQRLPKGQSFQTRFSETRKELSPTWKKLSRGNVPSNLVNGDSEGRDQVPICRNPDALFSLEPATVLFVRQGEKVRQGQLIAEFSAIGPEVNETIEAKRTLFSEMAGQVSFANMAMGTRFKENGEILQISKDLGFIWVLSGKRSPLTPLLSVYNRGCHLISKNSLLTRISNQVKRESLHLPSRKYEINRDSSNAIIKPTSYKKSQSLPSQLLEKEQRDRWLPIKMEEPLVIGDQMASPQVSTPPMDRRGLGNHSFTSKRWPSRPTSKLISGFGYSLVLFSTNKKLKPVKNDYKLSKKIATRLQVSPSGKPFAKRKGVFATCFQNPAAKQSLVPGLTKSSRQLALAFPWLSFALPSRGSGERLPKQLREISEWLTTNEGNGSNPLFDMLFVSNERSDGKDFYRSKGDALPPSLLDSPLAASLQGVNFDWFSTKHRVAKGGFAWIDSRYANQTYTLGEMFWIEEDAFRCHLFLRAKDPFLQPTTCNKVEGIYFLNNTHYGAAFKGKQTGILVDIVGMETGKFPRPYGIEERKVPIYEKAVSLHPQWFVQQVEGAGTVESNCLPFPQQWTDRGVLFLGEKNLQGRLSRQLRCPTGWIKKEGQQLFNRPSHSMAGGSTFLSVQAPISQGTRRGNAVSLEKEDRNKPHAKQGTTRRGASNRAPSDRRVSAKSLQHGNFQKAVLQDGRLAEYKKSLNVGYSAYTKRSTLYSPVNHSLMSNQDSFRKKSVLLPNLQEKGFNPLSKGFHLHITGKQTFLQHLATAPWALSGSRTIIKPTLIGQVKGLKSWASSSTGSDANIIEEDATKIKVSCRRNPSVPSFQPSTSKRLLERLAKRWNLHSPTPDCGGTYSNVQKRFLATFRLKKGWMYYPKDTARLSACHETLSQANGANVDTVFFDSALVYLDALNSPTFSYHLTNIEPVPSLNLKRLERKKVASSTSLWKGNRVIRSKIYSIFDQMLLQSKANVDESSKGTRPYNLSKVGLSRSRQLPSLLAWKPTLFLYDVASAFQLNSDTKDRQTKNPWVRRLLPDKAATRDLLLFLRKLLWLSERPLPTLTSKFVLRDRLFASKPEQLGDAKTKLFHLLFWRDLTNHRQFLWLRGFPLQFQVVMNQKARHRINAFPYTLPDKPSSISQDNHVTKNIHNRISISGKRSLESQIRKTTHCYANGQVPPSVAFAQHAPSTGGPRTPALLGIQRIYREVQLVRWPPLAMETLQSASLPFLLFALVRKAHRYSIEKITKGKAGLVQSIPSTRLLFKGERKGKSVIRRSGLGKNMVSPTTISNSIRSYEVDTIPTTIAATISSSAATGLQSGIAVEGPPSWHIRKSSFQFRNKQLPTKLISKAPAIGFFIKPFLAFNRFQTTSVSKPIQIIKFVAHFVPSRPRWPGAASEPLSQDPAIGKLVSPLSLMSSQVGEMLAPPLPSSRAHYETQGYRGGKGARRLTDEQSLPRPLTIPLLANKPSINATLLTEIDCVSLSTTHQGQRFPSDLMPVTQRSVGQFLNLGEAAMFRYSSPFPGQIVSIEREKITLRRAQVLLFYVQGGMHVNHGEWVDKNAPILTLTYQKLVTGDIVAGIPKIEQFFEAPATKEGEPIPNSLQVKLRKIFHRLKSAHSLAHAAKKSLAEIQQILVEGILKVYLSQGVRIADKHLEIVIRQMTSKGHVLDVGNTGLFQGEHVNLHRIERINLATYGEKADYEPAIFGITQASLDSESFISAASFQETTRVLSRDTVAGKTDFLRGLKERVVLGDLIQAGTGLDDNINYGLLLGVSMLLPHLKRASQDQVYLEQRKGGLAEAS